MKSVARAAPRPHAPAPLAPARRLPPVARGPRSRRHTRAYAPESHPQLSITVRRYQYYSLIKKWMFLSYLSIWVLVSYMKMWYGRVDRKRLKRRQEACRVGRGFVRAVLRPRRRLYAQHPPARHVALPPSLHSLPAAVQPNPLISLTIVREPAAGTYY